MSKKQLFRWSVLTAFFFALGFTYEYHLPQIESWLLVQIEDIAAKHAPVQVRPARLRLSLLPPGVVLQDVEINPKKGLDRTLAPTHLKEVALGINFWALIRGEVRLSRVILRDSTVTIFLKPELFEKKSATNSHKFRIEDLKDLPIDEIGLENMTLMGRVDPQGLVFKISGLDVDLINLYNSLYLYFGSPSVQMKPAGPYPTLNLDLQGRGLVDSGELRVSAFKAKSQDSYIVASGLLNGDMLAGKFDTGQLSMRTHINLADLAVWARVLPHPPALPTMSGAVILNTDLAYKGKNLKPELHAHLETTGVKVDKFVIGDVTTDAMVAQEHLTSDSITVKNSAGTVAFENVRMQWKPDLQIQGVTDIRQIELHQLLENLGVHKVPVHLDVQGKAACHGSYTAHLNIVCDGGLQGQNLEVRNDSGKRVIVKAKIFSAKGTTTIDETKVKYQAEATLGEGSKGRSSGVIDFDKGFKIQYEGDRVQMADILNLVDLKMEGSLKVKGSTEGTSDWATVDMNVETKDYWLEDFAVGDLKTNVAYKTGHLYLRDIVGQTGVSRYSGMVDINLAKEQISLAAKMPFVDLKDVRQVLSRRLPIPVEVSGTGTAQVTANGPLDIKALNYHATSEFFRGSIAKENFDVLHFDFEAANGVARTDRVLMTKANGQLEMRGVLKPAWSIDTVLVGRSLRLEQSELVTGLGLDLQGQADFNLVIRGPLKQPHVELNGRMSKVIIADEPQDDSQFHFESGDGRVSGSGSFFGNKVQTQFVFPIEPGQPFAFDAKTKDWNFISLFSLVSKAPNQTDFDTRLSMEAKLRSDQGGFWNSSGLVQINDLKIRRGAEAMQSNGPMKLIFNKGTVTSDNFAIATGDNFLKMSMQESSHDHLNIDMNGKMDLSLLSFLTPFISDLRGNLAITLNIKGSLDRPQLSGSSFLDKTYVRLRDFPHPFSNVRADLLFNQQTLVINTLRGELGGGKLAGEGRVSFLGKENIPIDVSGTFSDVALNIPDGFKTRGSGDVAITGHKFPYLMTISYDVDNADVTSEFAADDAGGGTVRASTYLPKFVTEGAFDPFQFDIDLKLKRPGTINNSMARVQVQGQVKIKGTPNQLLLTGNFTPLPGGKVFFHNYPFDITTANVEYAGFPPDDPRIYLTATTHASEVVQDQQHLEATTLPGTTTPIVREVENQYDISLLVQGRIKPAPQITLTSQPPLSQRDIVSLLALGMTPTALDEQHGSSSGAGSAIGAALLQQPVGKKLKDDLGLDLKVGTSQPTATDTATAPMVTISKQWTPKFSASASSTVGSNPTTGAKLEYKVNQSISVIGSYEDRDQSTTVFQEQLKSNDTSNIFGLDLEYKVQFK